MLTDALPETQHHPNPPDGRKHARSRRWPKWGLLVIGVGTVLAYAAVLIPDAGSLRQTGHVLTHTVTRGDVIVTVTERGTLESADNTEIKCKVRGQSTVIWVIEGGTEAKPGDELVRLDTLAIDEAIAERTKYAHLTRSEAERSRADVVRAELAISEYLEGRYPAELDTRKKDLLIANRQLLTAENILAYAKKMAERGYVSDLEIAEKTFAVTQAKLNVEVIQKQIDVLEKYTKAMQLETLKGDLRAAKAKLAADEETARMDAIRRDLALEEREYCVIRAERSGLVIHPSAARWKNAPEIEEGATVYMDQVLLLMPNLSKMQVRVGIHESIVERIKVGMPARITLPDKTLDGKVSSVALVTRPAGWWTGNVVKYDTIVELPSVEGLKPGMSAEVEVTMARHVDVLNIPVSAVLETTEGDFCWVKTAEGTKRRSLELGDTNDAFIVVKVGLKEGEEVVLDPLASIEEAQMLALKPIEQTIQRKVVSPESDDASEQQMNPEADHVN